MSGPVRVISSHLTNSHHTQVLVILVVLIDGILTISDQEFPVPVWLLVTTQGLAKCLSMLNVLTSRWQYFINTSPLLVFASQGSM